MINTDTLLMKDFIDNFTERVPLHRESPEVLGDGSSSVGFVIKSQNNIRTIPEGMICNMVIDGGKNTITVYLSLWSDISSLPVKDFCLNAKEATFSDFALKLREMIVSTIDTVKAGLSIY